MGLLSALKWIGGTEPSRGPVSWNDLSTMSVGTRVKFSMRAVFPLISSVDNAEGKIEDNLINASPGMVFVRLDTPPDVAKMLVPWGGLVKAYAPDQAARGAASPFSVVED